MPKNVPSGLSGPAISAIQPGYPSGLAMRQQL